MDGDVEAMTEELYGVMPDEFVARRAALARQARAVGDRALATRIAGLRKPTTASWLVNALVRRRRAEVEQLLDLGAAMREAQAALAGDQLRELTRRRQQVVAAMARQARALAHELGHPVSSVVADEVEQTLRAALADPAVAEVVRGGRLTSSISYAGLGETATANAQPVAAPAMDTAMDTSVDAAEAAARVEALRAEVREAEADVARATAELDGAESALATAQSRHEAAREDVSELEARLQQAQRELVQAGEGLAALRRDRDAARLAAITADRRLAAARGQVATQEQPVL